MNGNDRNTSLNECAVAVVAGAGGPWCCLYLSVSIFNFRIS